jgi:hypothetical protein
MEWKRKGKIFLKISNSNKMPTHIQLTTIDFIDYYFIQTKKIEKEREKIERQRTNFSLRGI